MKVLCLWSLSRLEEVCLVVHYLVSSIWIGEVQEKQSDDGRWIVDRSGRIDMKAIPSSVVKRNV
ncbi:hypothetical protein PGB90_005509 [Kerria lacca]